MYLLSEDEDFMTTCETYYQNSYDLTNTKYDPIDLSGQMEASQLCSQLLGLVKMLRTLNEDSLNEVIKFSYLLSL